ncbi:MAG: cation-translocating P-type ATPase [Candidatus Bathyarchaeota archaeon]|nr:cation-translocating P-type ATPase [Candidatus Termiticorpusculum sp.]MCL1970551.1 cation-translocating P-type ATPase [Candidatus Termiticorpusculum sp.]
MANCKNKSGGLTTKEVKSRQLKYGKNELTLQKRESFVKKVFHTLCEPMFLLLLIAAVIYFILGEPRDGVIMLFSVVGIISIDIVQKWKTDKTLHALKDLSAPHIKVLRNGKETQIASVDLVPGDIMMIHEGVKIPADGFVVSCNDLCVDESSLTGESERVWKVSIENSDSSHDYWRKDYCYASTLVLHGSAVVCVDKIGKATEYGKIGVNVSEVSKERTPLQLQIGSLVKICVGIAAVLFALVSVVTWFNISSYMFQDRLIGSVLAGVTITMALIPEEFPVILTVFLSMGAWRLAKKESLVRKLSSVETLGAVSVLCVDKTGTLTMNQMTVQEVWAVNNDGAGSGGEEGLSKIMGLACETSAYDPMEKAMLDYCEKCGLSKQSLFGDSVLLAEYAFTPELKMMGHVWRCDGKIVIAAKGSPERILTICQLTADERVLAERKIYEMGQQGLRVIAVAAATLSSESDIPKNLVDCTLTICGLIGLVDPPRETVKNDVALCSKAGIRIVMITGDNGITAAAVAKRIDMKNYDSIITGDELEKMSDADLRMIVKRVNIFSRVTPEHKLRIVKAFKDNGEIVAMTGDGVNDAPALKYADIGIAMGKRGSEVSREAADLILMNDNFSTIVDTVKDGRRIYDNIRKAVSYVFTIHVPVALVTLFAPLLGIYHTSLLLLPLHIVLLELIIDPTCSIVLERQPAETNIMKRPPRNPKEKLLDLKTLTKCILQGITIFATSFGIYYYMLTSFSPNNAFIARSMGLAVLIFANLFLVQVNSSNTDNIFTSLKRLSKDKVLWTANILTIIGLFAMLYSPLNSFLKLAPLSAAQLLFVLGIAAASVLWYEIVKIVKKLKEN